MPYEILPKPKPFKRENPDRSNTKYCPWCLERSNPPVFKIIKGSSFLCKYHYEIFNKEREKTRVKEYRKGTIRVKDAEQKLEEMFIDTFGNRHKSISRWATIRTVILRQYHNDMISESDSNVFLRIIDRHLFPFEEERRKRNFKKRKTKFKVKRKKHDTGFMLDRIVEISKNNKNETNTE